MFVVEICITRSSARKWNDILKDAREELAADKKTKFVRPRDTEPPRLSAQGFRSLAMLLHQRVRADEVRRRNFLLLFTPLLPTGDNREG